MLNLKEATDEALDARIALLEGEIEANDEENRMMAREIENIRDEIGSRSRAHLDRQFEAARAAQA